MPLTRTFQPRPLQHATRPLPRVAHLALIPVLLLLAACAPMQERAPRALGESDIEQYIAGAWDNLTRSPLAEGALVDPKVPQGQSLLYVPSEQPITDAMRAATARLGVQIRTLPPEERVGAQLPELERQGLLYVPNPYVVPGGRFNEMYGWDSHFIVEGLVEGGRGDLARGMTENFFYQLNYYGAILNANRTYYLTRSQPPFLTSMITAVGRTLDETARRQWIIAGYAAAQKDWAFWNQPAMRAGETGLSRYFDFGRGPVPEMQDDPAYYQMVMEKLLAMGDAGRPFLRDADAAAPEPKFQSGGRTYALTDDFYLGDRAMRASGYDISFRFGPYGGATHHFAPVCLNTLLYREELDLAAMAAELGRTEEAAEWRARASARKAAMMLYLWDDQKGLFFDYNFTTARRSEYLYATAMFPLWAGMVSQEDARRVADHLDDFLQPGGIAMSTWSTGVQWDLPYGWAPVQLLVVEGLRRYGFTHKADVAAERWLTMIVDNFRKEGTLREKYDVVRRSAEVRVDVGYTPNVIGFGWTNGVFLKLLHQLPPEAQTRVLAPRG